MTTAAAISALASGTVRAAGRTLCAATLAAALLAVSPAAQPATDPAARDAANLGLQKLGEGRMTYFGISLYTASLWSETTAGEPDPDAEPVMLQINYERNVSRDRIMKITRKEWRRLEVADPAQQQAWLNDLEALLPDVRRGDVLFSLTVPGKETRFYHAGREIGRIADPAFGEAFLAIWLDPRTRAAKLREALLTQS